MGIFDSLERALKKRGIQGSDSEFLEATMAGVALITLADNDERLAELVARDRILVRLAELKTFDPKQAVAVYESYTEKLRQNRVEGERAALNVLARRARGGEDTKVLVRAFLNIANADQQFTDAERRLFHRICLALDVSAEEFLDEHEHDD